MYAQLLGPPDCSLARDTDRESCWAVPVLPMTSLPFCDPLSLRKDGDTILEPLFSVSQALSNATLEKDQNGILECIKGLGTLMRVSQKLGGLCVPTASSCVNSCFFLNAAPHE